MLYDPARHEPLRPLPWDEGRVRAVIERIVTDTESRYAEDRYWPLHPRDRASDNETEPFETSLYDGACGVIWALHYLQSIGAAALARNYGAELDRLLARNRDLRLTTCCSPPARPSGRPARCARVPIRVTAPAATAMRC